MVFPLQGILTKVMRGEFMKKDRTKTHSAAYDASSDGLAAYLFHQGTNYYSYEYLGVNSIIKNGEYQYTFRVGAPNADKVGLISDIR